ncbi:hypothetical protein GOODEAATRI_025451, partial [Goodea atripinnis]
GENTIESLKTKTTSAEPRAPSDGPIEATEVSSGPPGNTPVVTKDEGKAAVRSRVELATVLQGTDLTSFEYKTGKFHDGDIPPPRGRGRMKKRYRERSSSESSWMERGDGAETPESHHRLTPNITPKIVQSNQKRRIRNRREHSVSSYLYPLTFVSVKIFCDPLLFLQTEGKALPVNKQQRHSDLFGCRIAYIQSAYCILGLVMSSQQCKTEMIQDSCLKKTTFVFSFMGRQWIPCGQCVGCHNTIDCGQCANCKHGLKDPETRKRLCRKRRCICPIRKVRPRPHYTYSRKPNSKRNPEQQADMDFTDDDDDDDSNSQPVSLKRFWSETLLLLSNWISSR